MEREVEAKIIEVLKDHFQLQAAGFSKSFVNGGSLNETYRVALGSQKAFCKVNSANKFPQLFELERNGLNFLGGNSGIKTPSVIACFELQQQQVLLMEWIEQGEKTAAFWKNFGRSLAEMHQVGNDRFGWTENNYMGVVPQLNHWHRQWSGFFREERLEPLIRLCMNNGSLQPHHVELFQKIYTRLDDVFDPDSKPSLVHGDLWKGNFIARDDGQAVLIDPAVYFGHSAVDLGMTTLFGGFPELFYESYRYYLPFSANYRQQWKIANLYPLLIHLYLFGRSYLRDIELTLSAYE